MLPMVFLLYLFSTHFKFRHSFSFHLLFDRYSWGFVLFSFNLAEGFSMAGCSWFNLVMWVWHRLTALMFIALGVRVFGVFR